jgi:Holliday junction resolvase RusA-like endonuclease
MQTFTFYGDVPTKKNRQRIGLSRSGRPLIYKPEAVKAFEQKVQDEVLVRRGREILGDMQVSVTLIYGKHEPDLDGTITTVLDALQDAGLFANDAKVTRIHDCEKRRSTSANDDPPRVIVTIGSI